MKNNFYKIVGRSFLSSKPSFIKNFNLSKNEIRALNNQMKEEWVKPGWDKFVKYFYHPIGWSMVTRMCRSNNWNGSCRRLCKIKQSWFIYGEMGSRTYIYSENRTRLAK